MHFYGHACFLFMVLKLQSFLQRSKPAAMPSAWRQTTRVNQQYLSLLRLMWSLLLIWSNVLFWINQFNFTADSILQMMRSIGWVWLSGFPSCSIHAAHSLTQHTEQWSHQRSHLGMLAKIVGTGCCLCKIIIEMSCWACSLAHSWYFRW